MHTFTVPSDPKQAGRLRAALGKRFNFDGTVCTLGERIITVRPVRRSEYIRHYARKKRDGCYARLRTPKHEYTLWYNRPGLRESGLSVPKLVFDAMPHLATRTTEEPVAEERPWGNLVSLTPF